MPAPLVANPGCYPTCAILALAPLLRAGLIELDDLIICHLGSLAHAGYANPISRLTHNVLRRFLDPAPFAMPDEVEGAALPRG